MEFLEQENQLLREEMAAMQTKMDEMTELMKTLTVAQAPPPPMRAPPVAMTYSAPVIHTIPQDEEPIYHSGDMEAYDRVNDLQQKYDEIQRDMRALHGKKVFGKTAYDLCLVPNVQIPTSSRSQISRSIKGTPVLRNI
jgi:hypothetical protein